MVRAKFHGDETRIKQILAMRISKQQEEIKAFAVDYRRF